METFESTVQQVLQKGRIGSPVFVRWILSGPGLEAYPTLACMLATTECWFGSDTLRLHTCGNDQKGQVAVSVLFECGQTALLIFGGSDPCSDLMMLGNQGAAYHEDRLFVPPLSQNGQRKRLQELALAIQQAAGSMDVVQVGEEEG